MRGQRQTNRSAADRARTLAKALSLPVLARAWQMLLKGVAEVETAPDRKAAAEFSFFLAIPTMLGAGALDLYKGWRLIDGSLAIDIAVASVAAFVTAIIVVRAFVAYIARHDFTPFGWYRIVAGVVMLGLLATGAV